MKKTVCLILALVLCIGLLAACGDKKTETPVDAAPTPKPGELVNTSGNATQGAEVTPPPAEAKYADTINWLLDDKIALINPLNAGATCAQMGYPYHMIYDTLINYTLDGEYEPCLALEWTPNADCTVYTFKLREGVKWHDGNPFTSDDVKYTIEAGWAEDAAGSPINGISKQVESVECPDDYTVVVNLKASNYDFTYDCANIVKFPILSRKAMEKDPANGPMVGTGPFYMAEFVSSDYCVCKRNDDYFGEKPYTETFVFRYIAEETARYLVFENDEADMVVVNSAHIPEFIANPNYEITSNIINNCGYAAMNCLKAPLDDVNLRLAIAYAIDDDAIVELGFSGWSQTHDTGAIWGWSSAYKNTNIEKRTQDLAKSKEYLDKSKYAGEKLQIAAAMPHTKRIAAVIQAQLTAAGINCEVYECDGPTLTSMTKPGATDLDIIVNSLVFTPLANSIEGAVMTGNPNNKANWYNDEAIELAQKASTTPDGPEREAMYFRIQELLYEESPYITTTHNVLYTATHKGFGGAKYYATGYNDVSMAYRLIED